MSKENTELAPVVEQEVGTELAIPQQEGGLAHTDETGLSDITSGTWTARLQLKTSNSDVCKSGDFPINHWAKISGKNHTDLGAEVDVVPVAWRSCAIDTSEEEMVIVYDSESPEFQAIQKKAGVKDSGCMFGPQILVWVPELHEFVEYLMGSPTARNESASIISQIGKVVTLSSQKIEGKKFTWYGPTIAASSTSVDLPDATVLKEALELFNNPPKEVVEAVEEGAVDKQVR